MGNLEPVLKLEHADARGEIYSFAVPDNRELMLLHSVPGVFRGGHSHDCDEMVMVLSGKMRYYKRHLGGKEVISMLGDGDDSFNPAGLIHMGEFLEDTWLIELKLARKGEWKQVIDEPYRRKVEASAV